VSPCPKQRAQPRATTPAKAKSKGKRKAKGKAKAKPRVLKVQKILSTLQTQSAGKVKSKTSAKRTSPMQSTATSSTATSSTSSSSVLSPMTVASMFDMPVIVGVARHAVKKRTPTVKTACAPKKGKTQRTTKDADAPTMLKKGPKDMCEAHKWSHET
jgi:hypothetical protein